MANLPQSISTSGATSFGASSATAKDRSRIASVEHLVLQLNNPDLRENALHELSKVPTFRRFPSLVRRLI